MLKRLSAGYWALAAIAMVSNATALEDIPKPQVDDLPATVSEAIDQFTEEVERFRDEGGSSLGLAYGQLGMVYHAHELLNAASAAYRNAVELAGFDARWSYLLGVLLAEQGDYAAAERSLRASLEENSGYVPTRIRLARVLFAQGQLDASEQLYDGVLADYPENAACLYGKAQILIQKGDFQGAVDRLVKALEAQPAANRLRYTLAQAYRALGDAEKAEQELARQGPREPLYADPVLSQMRAHSRSSAQFLSAGHEAARAGDYKAAGNYFTRAVELEPGNVMARVSLARALEAVGQVGAAEQQLDHLLEAGYNDALLHYNKGVMHEYRADDAAAEASYRRALAAQPDLLEARVLLANTLMRTGRHAEAAELYGALVRDFADRVDYAYRLAMAQYQDGRCLDAVNTIHGIVERLPENYDALLAYSRTVATCEGSSAEQLSNALNASRNLYALSSDMVVTETLAMVEAAAGNQQDAVDHQSEALFAALRHGDSEYMSWMQEQLEAYRAGRRASGPYPPDSGAMKPPRITIAQRR